MYGPQSGNMEHQLKFAGTYQITEKLEAGMVFNWNSGYLFTKGKSVYRRNVPAQGEAYEVGGLSRNWIENQFSNKAGIKYIQANGLDLVDLHVKTSQAAIYCRSNRSPVFLHMKTVRLMGHAGSDIETGYMSQDELRSLEKQDPLLFSAKILIDNKCLRPDEIINLYENSRKKLEEKLALFSFYHIGLSFRFFL